MKTYKVGDELMLAADVQFSLSRVGEDPGMGASLVVQNGTRVRVLEVMERRGDRLYRVRADLVPGFSIRMMIVHEDLTTI